MWNRIFTSIVLIVFVHIISTTALSEGTKSEKIDKIVKEYYDAHQLNGVVLVAERGKIIHKKANGYADFAWGIKNKVDTK